ncbi:MAG: hypothetical protein ACXAHE_00105 [Roseburia sp. 1XD42-69]
MRCYTSDVEEALNLFAKKVNIMVMIILSNNDLTVVFMGYRRCFCILHIVGL